MLAWQAELPLARIADHLYFCDCQMSLLRIVLLYATIGCRADSSHNREHSFATLVHERNVSYSLFVRLA